MGRKKNKHNHSKRTKYSNLAAKKGLVKANELFNTAIQYHQTGQLQDAEVLYCQTLQIIPNHSDALNMYGVLSCQLGKFDVGANLIRKAIAINPCVPDYHSNLSIAIKSLGKLEEAIACCKRAIELKPDYAEAHNNMGSMFRDGGKIDEAMSCYQKAVQLKPDYAEAYNNMGCVFKDGGKVDEAISCYQKAVQLKPEYAEAYNNMGCVFIDEDRTEEAITYCQKAVQLKPDYAEARYNLGIGFQNQGKPEEAIRSFRRVVELDPENATGKHMLAALTGKTTETAPRQYVKDLFDQYSKRFDHHLVEKLGYRVPTLLRKLLSSLFEDNLHFRNAIDLGCGTGLSGMKFRSISDHLTGLDISPNMLQVAKNKKIYDVLQHIDILEFLNKTNEKYDLFIATDVFIYVGGLKPVFQSIQKCSLSGAYLVFSTESTDGNRYILRQTGRYAHSLSYIESLARQHDFVIEMSSSAVIRKEKEQKIMGNLFILKGNI